METPNTQAGRYTEEIMARVCEKLPLVNKNPPGDTGQDRLATGLTTYQYNRVWEAVYHWLDEFEFPEEDAK